MNNMQKKLIVIGDSGVYGWGDREAGGWCERLRCHWMSDPGAPVVYTLGVRGDGLESVARRWQREWQCRGELRRQVPDAVLLAIGLNDTARIGRPDGRPQLTADAYRFGLQQLLTEMRRNAKVMVMGLTPVDEAVMPFAECLWYSNQAASVYEAQLEDACLEADVPFLPIHAAMLEEPNWLSWIEPDGIHLNSEGHSWIHKRVMAWSSLLTWAQLEPLTSFTPTVG
ncbi:MAG: GDSL-type esterase/lipase family protein [Prochlorococcus sp.]|jgi:lysophospholipase L1-like esterase|nr:GDSL-type esterase/lipase family protein [Prochlorococcaceae cyanobacterium ETNP18_MAG_14]HJM80589.1 GDSL-type esterase/lipase family protein [Prochlorococcaceae cyanobacterium Fu_MAG_72]|tara:strand:- start:6901 stop:7578 length:678 start_codon:yes stop_codon:yes gene_type:complete